MNNNNLNSMCKDCPHLDNLCNGDHSGLYGGCIWKAADARTFESFLQKAKDTAEKKGDSTE